MEIKEYTKFRTDEILFKFFGCKSESKPQVCQVYKNRRPHFGWVLQVRAAPFFALFNFCLALISLGLLRGMAFAGVLKNILDVISKIPRCAKDDLC